MRRGREIHPSGVVLLSMENIEARLRRDAESFQIECGLLDEQGALRRTLEALGLEAPSDPPSPLQADPGSEGGAA
jgi:hypothetical protein